MTNFKQQNVYEYTTPKTAANIELTGFFCSFQRCIQIKKLEGFGKVIAKRVKVPHFGQEKEYNPEIQASKTQQSNRFRKEPNIPLESAESELFRGILRSGIE